MVRFRARAGTGSFVISPDSSLGSMIWLHESLPHIAPHAAARPCTTSRHAFSDDPIRGRTKLIRQTSDRFGDRGAASSAQTVQSGSHCGTDVFDQLWIRARHG